MAANTAPIYTLTPKNGFAAWLSSTTANTKSDGTGTIGTDMLLAYTAGASGAFINKVRLNPAGTTAATATTATVARIYRSTLTSGATTGGTNTWQLAEVACPAQTSDQTTTATNFLEVPLGIALAPNETILVSMHHAAASATLWMFNVFASDY